jgi:hypothetical protein
MSNLNEKFSSDEFTAEQWERIRAHIQMPLARPLRPGQWQALSTRVVLRSRPPSDERSCRCYSMTGSVCEIEVDVGLHAGWPHPLELTPGICPAWGVMS